MSMSTLEITNKKPIISKPTLQGTIMFVFETTDKESIISRQHYNQETIMSALETTDQKPIIPTSTSTLQPRSK